MKTSFSKKLLACVMSLCMILTVCAGALSVSAATAGVTIGTDTVDAGVLDEAVISVTVNAEDATVYAAHLYVNVPAAADITKVQVVTARYKATFASEEASVTAEADAIVEAKVDEVDNVANFVLEAEDDYIGDSVVTINFTFAGTFEAGTHFITLTDATIFGSYDEEVIAVDLTDVKGEIEAIAAHVHTEEVIPEVPATCTTPGSTAGVKCSECDEIITAPTTIDALGHAYDEGVVTTAPDCNNAGVKTFTCGRCGDTYTEAINATGHTPADALVNNGDDHSEVCAVCGATLSNADHDFTDGDCVCGAKKPVEGPVLDETIAPAAHGVGIGETFGISFRYDLSTINEAYQSFRIDIKRTSTAGDFNFIYEETSFDTFTKNTRNNILMCTTAYYGIQLFSLSAPIEYTLHCFDADGNEVAYSETFTTTLADVAIGFHNLSTTSDALKKVMADLVQVGAAALNHFTANRTKACDYSTLPVPTIDSNFITTELGEMATYNSTEGTSVTITGGVQQSLYYNMRFSDDVANKDKYSFEVKFYNALKKTEETYTVDSSTFKGNATTISAQLATFPVFATNADTTFVLYEDGVVVGTSHYCLEKYISDTIEKSPSATLKVMLQEIGELAQSFRAARNI